MTLRKFKVSPGENILFVPDYFPNRAIESFIDIMQDTILAKNPKLKSNYFSVVYSEENIVFRFFNKSQIKELSEKEGITATEKMHKFIEAQMHYGVVESDLQFGMKAIFTIDSVGTLDYLISQFKD